MQRSTMINLLAVFNLLTIAALGMTCLTIADMAKDRLALPTTLLCFDVRGDVIKTYEMNQLSACYQARYELIR